MELKFDIYAMTRPKSPEDILALLREFRAEVANLQAHWDALDARCEADLTSARAAA